MDSIIEILDRLPNAPFRLGENMGGDRYKKLGEIPSPTGKTSGEKFNKNKHGPFKQPQSLKLL